MSDAATFLRRYADENSEEAFGDFVRGHFNLVYSAALRQADGDPHAAQEIALDVFADAARNARFLAGHPAIVGWLYTSTHFRAAKHRWAEQRRRQRDQTAHAMNELNPSPAEWSAVRPHLDDAMHALPERDRDVVLLRFFEQLSYAAIAQQLGLQENTAQMRVSRALEKLRAILARQGVTSTAAALGVALANEAVAAAPAGACAAATGGALLQAGSVGLGPASLAWHFMITSKVALSTIGVLTAVALGCGWYATHETQHAVAAATRARHDLARLAPLPAPTASPRASARRTPKPATSSGSTTKATGTAPTDPNAATLELERALGREMTENPELRHSLGARERARFHLDHLALYRQLGLTTDQIEAVEKAHLKASSDELDLTEAAAELGGTTLTRVFGQATAMPLLASAQKEAVTRQYETLRPLLGDQALAQLEDFDRTSAVRSAVNRATAPLIFSNSPLTSAPRDELVRSIMAHSADHPPGVPVNLSAIEWTAVLRDTATHLAPAQIEALQASIEPTTSAPQL